MQKYIRKLETYEYIKQKACFIIKELENKIL